jgi:hypothetical protein
VYRPWVVGPLDARLVLRGALDLASGFIDHTR